MTSDNRSAREDILQRTRMALGRGVGSPVAPLPASARVETRVAGDGNSEIESLMSEIAKLGGKTRRISDRQELVNVLRQLVDAEAIKKATLWQTAELCELQVEETLRGLGVENVSPHSDKYTLAECDLGVTSVDGALPETGTLVLRSSPERPRAVSLLPRVHLAIMRPAVLFADMSQALERLKGEGYWVFVTGPSRTSDIELTTTIGVHGPKSLHVWVYHG